MVSGLPPSYSTSVPSSSSPPPSYVSSYVGHSSQSKSPLGTRASPSVSPLASHSNSRGMDDMQSTSRVITTRPDILRLRNVLTPERQRYVPGTSRSVLLDSFNDRTPASNDSDDDTGSSEGLSGYYPPPPEPAPPDFLPSSSISVAAAAVASATSEGISTFLFQFNTINLCL